jgi:hypothetical protein
MQSLTQLSRCVDFVNSRRRPNVAPPLKMGLVNHFQFVNRSSIGEKCFCCLDTLQNAFLLLLGNG